MGGSVYINCELAGESSAMKWLSMTHKHNIPGEGQMIEPLKVL